MPGDMPAVKKPVYTPQEQAAQAFAQGDKTPEQAAKALLAPAERAAVTQSASAAVKEANEAIKAAQKTAQEAQGALK